jgi:hypothetical protein
MDLKIGMRIRLKGSLDAVGMAGTVEEIGRPEEMRTWKSSSGWAAGERLIRVCRKLKITRCALLTLTECEGGCYFLVEWGGRWWTIDETPAWITPEYLN